MTTLAANKARTFAQGDIAEYGVIAADIIYEGAFVGDNASGLARPLVAGDPFMGIAESKVDNSAGAAAGATVRVKTRGIIVMPVTGASAITARGADVYASDDDTLTLTQSTNTRVGYVQRWISGTTCEVVFEANQSALVELTDSSAGTASATTVAALADGTTYANDVAAIRNNFATLAAAYNRAIRRLGA